MMMKSLKDNVVNYFEISAAGANVLGSMIRERIMDCNPDQLYGVRSVIRNAVTTMSNSGWSRNSIRNYLSCGLIQNLTMDPESKVRNLALSVIDDAVIGVNKALALNIKDVKVVGITVDDDDNISIICQNNGNRFVIQPGKIPTGGIARRVYSHIRWESDEWSFFGDFLELICE